MTKFSIKQLPSDKKPLKKRLLWVTAVIGLAVGVIFILILTGTITTPFIKHRNEDTQESGINYGPPTKEEVDSGNNEKVAEQNMPAIASPSTDNSGTKKNITPIIVSVGQDTNTKNITARGLISGIFESNGTCTLKLEKEGQVIDVTNNSVIGAQTVTCGQLEINRSKLTAGSWNATITYSSATYEGSSDISKVQVL